MINLDVFGETAVMPEVASSLAELEGVSRVRVVGAVQAGSSVLTAAVQPSAVDALLTVLRRQGVPNGAITLTRVEVVGSLTEGPAEASLVWADVLGTAWLNARPLARYLAFMVAAGVIGCYGVIDNNGILIVGAMAVSPDLLPITAIGVGIAGRRPALAGRALLTLTLGLAIAGAAAAIFAFAQDRLDLIPSGFNLQADRGARRPHERHQRDDRGCPGCRRRRHAGAGDPRQLGCRRGHLGDDDPRRRLPRRRGRAGRVRDGHRRAGRARRRTWR